MADFILHKSLSEQHDAIPVFIVYPSSQPMDNVNSLFHLSLYLRY